MEDRNSYHMHTRRIEPVRQHYAQANAPQKPRVPTWVKLAALVALIGLAGGLTGCGGSDAVELQPALAPDKCITVAADCRSACDVAGHSLQNP